MAGGRTPIRQKFRRVAPRTVLAASLGLASLALPAAAGAQVATGPTREEINRGQLDRQLRTEGQAVAVEEGIERAPCPLANPQFADLRFTLRAAEFSGLEQIGADMVDPAWRDMVGQELPVAAVCEIRDRAATILRQAGYLAAVQVPAGSYASCLETVEEGGRPPGSRYETTYCPGVGMVLLVVKAGGSVARAELKSYGLPVKIE